LPRRKRLAERNLSNRQMPSKTLKPLPPAASGAKYPGLLSLTQYQSERKQRVPHLVGTRVHSNARTPHNCFHDERMDATDRCHIKMAEPVVNVDDCRDHIPMRAVALRFHY
jgi:hypothetical protein